MKSTLLGLIWLVMLGTILITDTYAATFIEFDNLPVTAGDDAPISGGGWSYRGGSDGSNSQWIKNTPYRDNRNIHNSFKNYSPFYNTRHMGFENYGYLQITDKKSITGHALEYVITGGKNSSTCPDVKNNCVASGLPLHTKQTYLDYVAKKLNPIAGDIVVGNPYLYFMNNSPSKTPVHFEKSQGANRLSFYIWMPSGLTIGKGGYLVPPRRTLSIGPYSNCPKSDVFPADLSKLRIGGHFYNDIAINGGGWIHVQIDGHPQHNNGFHNAAKFPFVSKSFRNIGESYFNNMYRFYVTTGKYNGFEIPKFSIYLDKIEFINDSEPQNNETINGLSILYKAGSQSFEVAFCDKYKDNKYSYATYQLRSSFSIITNNNWASATPVHIAKNAKFGIKERTDGKFDKNTPYYQSVWAPFKLNSADTKLLSKGRVVYFAVKDIGNIDSNGRPTPIPNDSLTGTSGKGGRDYLEHSSRFDWDGDSAVLTKLRRTEYVISE